MISLVWLPYTLTAILGLIGLCIKPIARASEQTPVDLVICSVADARVADALRNTIDRLKEHDNGGARYLIAEPYSDYELLKHARSCGWKVIVVPQGYDDGQAKGRAISYFVKYYVQLDRWYMFLDDDSYPMDDNYRYEITTAAQQGRLLGNCVLVPRRGQSLIAHLADNLRHGDDRAIFRMALQGTGIPLIGMHGEGLIAHGEILLAYWSGLDSITEDAQFAFRCSDAKVRTFQSSTEICIKSPNSVSDLWRQRRRWYLGLLGLLPSCPTACKMILPLRMFSWSVGWLGIPLWIAALSFGWVQLGVLSIMCGLGLAVLMGYYIIGAARTVTIVPAIFFAPVYTVAETMTALYVITHLRNNNSFEVIDKTGDRG